MEIVNKWKQTENVTVIRDDAHVASQWDNKYFHLQRIKTLLY